MFDLLQGETLHQSMSMVLISYVGTSHMHGYTTRALLVQAACYRPDSSTEPDDSNLLAGGGTVIVHTVGMLWFLVWLKRTP